MHRTGCFQLFLFLFLSPGVAFGDGGLLRFRPILPAETPSSWPVENGTLQQPRQATLTLDREEPENVVVYTSSGVMPLPLILSTSSPYRFFIDWNGDGKCQASEIHSPSRQSGQCCRFNDLRLPLRVGNTTPDIRVDTHVHPRSFVEVTDIKSDYLGSVSVGGSEYPARLVFRSPFPQAEFVNEIIILDANRDGSFEPFVDPWFSSEGVAWLNDALWVAQTVFSSSTAEVSLTAYTGPTGTLTVEGTGLHRLYLEAIGDHAKEVQTQRAFWIGLPGRKEPVYTLPLSSYCASNVWLRAGTEGKRFYQSDDTWVRRPKGTHANLATAPEGKATLPLGGPLKQTLRMNASSALLGKVHLDFDGCRNAAGLRYEPYGDSPLPRSYEILNRRGKVVQEGRFQYG